MYMQFTFTYSHMHMKKNLRLVLITIIEIGQRGIAPLPIISPVNRVHA